MPELPAVNPNIDSGFIPEGQEREAPAETPVDLLSTLPVEVISQIFCFACKPIGGNRIWQRDCTPLLFGRLSRRYRQYAWATSELWATIVIRVNLSKLAAQTELLEEWLARTMGRPIDIYFQIKTLVSREWGLFLQPSNTNQPSIIPMIRLLAKHSPHWPCIDFYLPSLWYPIFTSFVNSEADNDEVDWVTQTVSTNKPLDLPLLMSASFHRDGNIAPENRVNLDLTLAPSLRMLSLSRFQMSPNVFKGIDVKQITNLVCDQTFIPDVHDLLPWFPNLQEATFHHTVFPATTRRVRPQIITHQKLRKRELRAYQGNLLILSQAIFPRLESLSIHVSSAMHYSRLFQRFINRDSNSHLTSLSLSCKLTREFDLIDVLSALDSLRELYIQDCSTEATPEFGLSRTFFDVLHPEEDSPYLPSLEVFTYEGNLVVQTIDFLEPLLIRSRMRDGSSGTYENLEKMAIMRKVKIQADQVSNSAEFSIAEYPDTQYVWEVMMMMEQGILELITLDGGLWE